MTRLISKILVLLYIFQFASFSVSFAQSSPETSGVESRIKRVEMGLLPAVLVIRAPGAPGAPAGLLQFSYIPPGNLRYSVRVETREVPVRTSLFSAFRRGLREIKLDEVPEMDDTGSCPAGAAGRV